MSFVRSYVFLRLGKAKAYPIPTCQVHTSCESPVVAFGKEILTRSSFASSVSYHNIDEASLIFSRNKSKQDQYGDAANLDKKKKQQKRFFDSRVRIQCRATEIASSRTFMLKKLFFDSRVRVEECRRKGRRKSHVQKCLCSKIIFFYIIKIENN